METLLLITVCSLVALVFGFAGYMLVSVMAGE